MRKSFTTLLILMIVVLGWQGYQMLSAREHITAVHNQGALSDVADEVLSLPLHSTGGYGIDSVHFIRQDGNNVFLISKGIIYRFNRHGDLVCRITDPKMIHVAGYVLDPAHKRVVVLGNVDDVFYYSYDGRLIVRKKLKSNLGRTNVHSMALSGQHLVATVRQIDDQRNIEERIVEYDANLDEVRSYCLAHFPNDDNTVGCIAPQVAFTPDSGELYAWSAFNRPEQLVEDTLMLRNALSQESLDTLAGNDIPLLSVRMGSRIWLSSNDRNEKPYIFCFDNRTNQCWQVESLEDDFFHTGRVTALEPADDSGQCYTFVRNHHHQTVIYLVKMMA